MPTANLARRLRVARSTVQVRLARLEADGTIAGYTVRLGGRAAGTLVTALVSLVVDLRRIDPVIAALTDVAEIRTVHAVSGTVDLVALVRTATTAELDAVLDRIARVPGVERVQSSIVLRTPLDRDHAIDVLDDPAGGPPSGQPGHRAEPR